MKIYVFLIVLLAQSISAKAQQIGSYIYLYESSYNGFSEQKSSQATYASGDFLSEPGRTPYPGGVKNLDSNVNLSTEFSTSGIEAYTTVKLSSSAVVNRNYVGVESKASVSGFGQSAVSGSSRVVAVLADMLIPAYQDTGPHDSGTVDLLFYGTLHSENFFSTRTKSVSTGEADVALANASSRVDIFINNENAFSLEVSPPPERNAEQTIPYSFIYKAKVGKLLYFSGVVESAATARSLTYQYSQFSGKFDADATFSGLNTVSTYISPLVSGVYIQSKLGIDYTEPAAIPEPSSLILALFGFAIAFCGSNQRLTLRCS